MTHLINELAMHRIMYTLVYYSGKGEVVAGDHPNDRAFTWWLGRSPHSRERRGAGNTNLHDCRCHRVNRQATWSVRMMRERYWSTDGTCGRI